MKKVPDKYGLIKVKVKWGLAASGPSPNNVYYAERDQASGKKGDPFFIKLNEDGQQRQGQKFQVTWPCLEAADDG